MGCGALSCNGDSIQADNGLSFNCAALPGYTCVPGAMAHTCCSRAACAWPADNIAHYASETQGFLCNYYNTYQGFDCAATNRICVEGQGCVGTGA